MNRRHAFARFAKTASSGAAAHARSRRRQGQRARVGKTGQIYLDPAKFRSFFLNVYNDHPGIFSLFLILFSLGDRLTHLIETANEVERVGGGSAQLKLELMRRREDWFEIYFTLQQILFGNSEDPAGDFDEAVRWTFEGFPQDQGLFEYENGEQLPPKYGLAWEIGSLYNQVWAMWHPITWIGDDPDEPWFSWLPTWIAAGWVAGVNDLQALVADAPEQGPGWGAEIAAAASETESKVSELGQEGFDFAKKVGGMAGGALLGGLVLGGIVLGSRRR